MIKKLQLALLALLGFSAACSSVKNTPKGNDGAEAHDSIGGSVNSDYRIIVMYGARRPVTVDSLRLKEQSDSLPLGMTLDPIVERPDDETPNTPKK